MLKNKGGGARFPPNPPMPGEPRFPRSPLLLFGMGMGMGMGIIYFI